MNKWDKKDCTTILGAARKTGLKRTQIEEWIEQGKIEVREGYIHLKTIESILNEKEKYISVEAFLNTIKYDNFDPRYVKNRNKYIDFLEENLFFGQKITYPEEMEFPYESSASFYLKKEQIPKIEKQSEIFFRYFGYDEQEKIQAILSECKYEKTASSLKNYLQILDSYTPIVTEFLSKIIKIDIGEITDKQVLSLIDSMEFQGSRDICIDYMDYIKKQFGLSIGSFSKKKKKTSKEIGAYPYSKYLVVAKNIFNEELIKNNQLIEKSLNKSFYFEQWLFLSAHYVCGWRAADICNEWPVIDERLLKRLQLDEKRLKILIMNNVIDENIYLEIGKYIEKKIELASTKPHKTAKASDLLAPIGKELKIFFGRMALISYYHYYISGEGLLKEYRIGDYLNHVKLRELFGDEIYLTFGRQNLSSRRLNKSYLQSMEDRARKNGAGTMAAYTIASFARNHADLDTTAMYIYDHGLTGETAEVVLSMMLDRGVFGTIRYKELLAAFPETFDKLTAREQTQLLAECETSAYELEVMSSDYIEANSLKRFFAEGNKEKTLEILSEMFEISQGFGKSKDKHIHCKKRALGVACQNPTFESCIAGVCPYLIFTEEGINSLIKVIYDYKEKANETNNPKYFQILNDVILPTYKDIMQIIRDKMTPTEAEALKGAIGEYNGKYIKNN